MKMFKVCAICINNLNRINYPTSKLAVNANEFNKCTLKPTCSGQPERSKREDSQVCEMRCSEHCSNAVRDK